MLQGHDNEVLFELPRLCIYAAVDENGPQILLCDNLDNPNYVIEIRDQELAVLNAIVTTLFNRSGARREKRRKTGGRRKTS